MSVTDLLDPRKALWRRTAPPVPLTADREARMQRGRRLHSVLGRLFAGEGSLEVRVRRAGLVGRIDVLTDRPIEVKSGSAGRVSSLSRGERPEHLEQLGMYCALLDVPAGQLVVLSAADASDPEVEATGVAFRQLPAIRDEMSERAELLRAGLARGRPEGLPRCRWFGRGCEFQEASVCDCTGDEPDLPLSILDRAERTERLPDLAARLQRGLRAELSTASSPRLARFREILYPRQAWYERARGTRPGPPGALAPPRAREPTVYDRLLEAVEGGPVGEVARLPTLASEPEEEVLGFRGDPVLLRTSRAVSSPDAGTLMERSPQYALELGFRCVASGRSRARLILAHERRAPEADPLSVFEFRFAPVTTFARLWRARGSELERAVALGAPDRLPACPAWMYPACPYREECGCADETSRSHR